MYHKVYGACWLPVRATRQGKQRSANRRNQFSISIGSVRGGARFKLGDVDQPEGGNYAPDMPKLNLANRLVHYRPSLSRRALVAAATDCGVAPDGLIGTP
jgi:hypothetical protein